MIVLHNNKFRKDAKVSVTGDVSRGYGVFETLRTYRGKSLPLLKKHVDRLFISAEKIQLKIRYPKSKIIEMVKKIVDKSVHEIQRIKIIVLSGDIVITSERVKQNLNSKNGVSLKSVKMERALTDIKSISYLPSFLAHEEALKNGFYDAILINNEGKVTEGAYCNIFWFEGEKLCTCGENIFPGMIRNIVLKISPCKVVFKSITLEELKRMKEIFITQSIGLVLPVIKIDNSKIGNGLPEERTKTMIAKFQSYIEKLIKKS
jgi:branched-subunit amino acid aminotransferase/4-amino-4-deoxychorismate lyase